MRVIALGLAMALSISAMADRPVLSGPEYSFVSDGGRFRVHWTDAGEDSTTLTYAQSVAVAADSSWTVQVDEMGFYQPPSDQGLGGDDLYDVYLIGLTGEGYVSTSGEPDDPSTPNNDSASHMVVSTGVGDGDERRCAVAGLFQLACQAAADMDEAAWLGENCSVWAQEQVYPNDDCYITPEGDGAIVYPWKPFSEAFGMVSGSFSWAWFIQGRLGDGAVLELWQLCAEVPGSNSWQACQEVFAGHGLDFADAFMEYGFWRFLTHEYWLSGWGYGPDAQSWEPGPSVLADHIITSLPDSANWSGSDENDPEAWGLNWIRVDLSECQNGWVTLDFDGGDGRDWRLGVILWRSDACQFQSYDVPQPSGELSVSVSGTGWDYAVFFPAQVADSGMQGVFQGYLSYETGIESGEGSMPVLELRGNPLCGSSSAVVSLADPGQVLLALYDLAGRRVEVLLRDDLGTGSHVASLGGLDLPAGEYLLVLRTESGLVARKAVLAP